MLDRQSIANDLNAIANAVTRDEDLFGIREELDIVIENLEQLAAEELPNAINESSPKEDPTDSSHESL